jgi:hypothetical protein
MDLNQYPRRTPAGNSDESGVPRTARAETRRNGVLHRPLPEPSQDRRAERLAAAERILLEAQNRIRRAGAESDSLNTVLAIARDCLNEAKELSEQARRELAMAHYEWGQASRMRQSSGRYLDSPTPVVPDVPGLNLCPDPSTARTVTDFIETLRMYRIWAGKPSYRAMEHQCGRCFAASTIHSALNGRELPSHNMVQAIITACGGSDEHREAFVSAWRRLAMPQDDAAHLQRPHNLYPISGTA